jgi:hypothetical protein
MVCRQLDLHLVVSSTGQSQRFPRSPTIVFSPTLTCVPAVEAAGALKAGDACPKRAGRVSLLLSLALQLADRVSKDVLHILERVYSGLSQHEQERLPVAYKENAPPPASKHPPPSPKPVKPLVQWATVAVACAVGERGRAACSEVPCAGSVDFTRW